VIAVICLLLPLAASCYVPDDFLAEIRLSRSGDYAIVFKGKLTWAPLVAEIRDGTLTAQDIQEKQEILRRDLARDSSFRQIRSLGNGTFEVFYERLGRFTGTRKVTFIRRSVEILSLEARTDGTLHMRGAGANGRDPRELLSIGLNPQGRLRVITDIPVLKQNAQTVSQDVPGYPRYRVYDWAVTLTSPTPVLIGQLFDGAR
jgi:hypothetical protein